MSGLWNGQDVQKQCYAKKEIKMSFLKDVFQTADEIKQNEEKFGYKRFDYLYLEDSLTESERINKTNDIINKFFA